MQGQILNQEPECKDHRGWLRLIRLINQRPHLRRQPHHPTEAERRRPRLGTNLLPELKRRGHPPRPRKKSMNEANMISSIRYMNH